MYINNLSKLKFLFLSPLLFLATSCQNATNRDDYIHAYQIGQTELAKNVLNQQIKKKIPKDNFTKCKDSIPLLLDKATIKFANGETKDAIRNYQLAIEAIDYYNQDDPVDTLCQISLQDDMAPYRGLDFEQVLARAYFSLALMQDGDEKNALALLKQAEKVQQDKIEYYSRNSLTENFDLIENPLVKYLLAVFLEHNHDASNAKILYNQTEKLICNNLSTFGLANQKNEENTSTVIIIVHNGNAPYKISKLSNASIASTAALEMMLGSKHPAVSSFTGIQTPQLMQKIFSNSFPTTFRLCRTEKMAIPLYDISQTAARQLENNLPLIVARSVARMVVRRAIVAGINEKNETMGAIADIGLFIANSCTEADTRGWHTLPNSIDLARFDIPAGFHTLHIQTNWGPNPTFIAEQPLKLEDNDLCIVNVFNIHPGVVSVQVPFHYKNNNLQIEQEESL